MATRREAREWAVQILFQLEANPIPKDTEGGLNAVFDEFWATQLRLKMEAKKQPVDNMTFTGKWHDRVVDKRMRKFTEGLVQGVLDYLAPIDEILAKQSVRWDITRLGGIERNVIRLALYEMKFTEKPPPVPVIINEAVDLGKFFCTRDSGRFINGILDKIAKEIKT